MAVTRMKKVTLIAQSKWQEELLKVLQDLQQVQVRDVFVQNVSNEWVHKYFDGVSPKDISQDLLDYQQKIQKINEAIDFVNHYGGIKVKNQLLKRQNLSLYDLDQLHKEEVITLQLREIFDLKQRWETVEQKLRHLSDKEEALFCWQNLDLNFENLDSATTQVYFGQIGSENYEAFKQEVSTLNNVYLELVYDDTKVASFACIYLKVEETVVKALFSRFSVVRTRIDIQGTVKNSLKAIDREKKRLFKEQRELTEALGQKRKWIEKLQIAEEYLLAQKSRLEAQSKLVTTKHLLVLQGWVGEDEVNLLTQQLAAKLGADTVYIDFEDPTTEEIDQEVPTKLKNHPLIRPFEMLIELYSLPKYNEIDPTPWMFPFFLVFFGMMVADIGYGALMLIGTTIALKVMVFPSGTERFVRFFQILSIPTIIWGIIYNSCFGESLPYKPILSTTNDVIQILLLTVIFGFIQILVGLSLAGYQNIKKKDYAAAITNGFAWQAILVGVLLAVAGKMLGLGQTVYYIGLFLAILGAASIVLIPTFNSQSKVLGFVGGLYDLYGISSYVGDLVSYTRLMALGISGGSIAAAFNLIVSFLPPVVRFTVGIALLLALHALNIFLSLLGAYVHGVRLQYVEYFGKFYEGGGRKFMPLKSSEKHVNIKWNNENNGGNQK
ncbi:V-type ATP synthase subunit I [Enterococcus cecorum]|uniref:V-type ATP synthase subunit I n=1 Tax=Enterococcus cecorum TaxID=44008 RepID=UPI001FADF732|nr:V-type ATP synthase subunit I [Enterococcus cecorum]MCJ0571252.1 V-type ATP synthase subunit I [Enterococcus cecorum]MCJ0590193.1 V-type ATP synthase subunit I [Enterococcus cecorum]MDZ5439897.1 V-type ATP synthase subunit I [Enterococcus cecorum]MDZ5497962.1 V-type ATP synthase subunit I [Enterococcus cecorum]MDZ5500196.1 V-type ATP synthase subunit I [Enterococcus cecorum]